MKKLIEKLTSYSSKSVIQKMVVLPLSLISLLLTGCANTVVKTEVVREPVPAVWVQPIEHPSLDVMYGDYIAECEALLMKSNEDKFQIKIWSERSP